MSKQIINQIPLKIQDLRPNPRNPRKITEERHQMLEKSMRVFGDLSGIVYNVRTKQLVGGHQRRAKINLNEEIVIDERYKKATANGTLAIGHVVYEGERFHVRVVDWDEKTEKAANIAANRHGGKFDLQILTEDLLDLDALNIDMDLTGFTEVDLENLFAPEGGYEEETKTVSFEASSGSSKEKCPTCGQSVKK